MKPKPNEYEVIILGSGLGGLIAGALLSKQNHSVLLLLEKGFKTYFEKGGYRFIPFSSLSEKHVTLDLIQTISQRVGLSPIRGKRRDQENGRGKKERVAFQVILPKSRIDLYEHWFLLKKELQREFPKEIFEIEKFYEKMTQIKTTLKSAKVHGSLYLPLPMRLRSLMKTRFDYEGSPFSKEFKKFLQLQLISHGNFYLDWCPISFLASHLLKGEIDEWVGLIDLEIFKNQIVEIFLNSGGRVEEVKKVEKIEMGWRRGFTLSLEGESSFHSKIFIFNAPLHHLTPLLGERKKKILKFVRKIQPSFILIPIFLGIQEKVIPVGMRDLFISILDLEKPLEGGNLLYGSLSPHGDEGMAPEGKRAFTVEGFMSLEKWQQGLFDEFREGVFRHLNRLIPFLEDYLELVDWEWVLEQGWRWSYSNYAFETPFGFNWRDGVVPTRISKNLYFTGKENFPYLGLEGEVWGGLKVGEEILKRFH